MVDEPRLGGMAERHLVALRAPSLAPDDPLAALDRDASLGLVIEAAAGCPDGRQLSLIRRGLNRGRHVWVYWPREGAVEAATWERLASYRRHLLVIGLHRRAAEPLGRLVAGPRRLGYAARGVPRRQIPKWMVERLTGQSAAADRPERLGVLRDARQAAQAVPFAPFQHRPDADHRLPGCGVYVRSDLPASSQSGGSDGHACDCHIAQELAAATGSFVCVVASHCPLMDAYGLKQIVMQPVIDFMRPLFLELRPAYVYERLSLGHSAAARLCAELGLPYIVEYNGSEIALRRSVEGSGYEFETEYLEAEALAFEQATLISVVSPEIRKALVSRGVDPAKILVNPHSVEHVPNLWRFAAGEAPASDEAKAQGFATGDAYLVGTGDAYKDQVQRQWNNDPAGSHYVVEAPPHTKEWFLEAERYRYTSYAPWMPGTMEFEGHADQDVLEIGGGMGTDLAQFAIHGARVTDVDLSAGHLALARENFALRGLRGRFIQQDAESLALDDGMFDVVYTNGVLHHTPNTQHVVDEIFRVLKPGGLALAMVYAEDSLHYWRNLVWNIGLREGQLRKYSMGEIMSRSVERSDNAAAHPLVKVYTRARLRQLFTRFVDTTIAQRQIEVVPRMLGSLSPERLGTAIGWNLIIKARKAAR